MIKPQTLKGFRDFLPLEARKRQYVINTLKEVFALYGFEPLETPALEYEEILTGKYGEEGDKLMYKFKDLGRRSVALRYDQTVPLARVVAEYGDKLPRPFKRYQISPVWRAENTQRGRYREFLQCDIDIVGSSSQLSDAEIVCAAAASLNKLGFKKYKIFLNDREMFANLSEDIIQVLDKLKKIGAEGVIKELREKKLVSKKATPEQLLNDFKSAKPTKDLKDIMTLLNKMGLNKEQYEFSPTLARGMNYYTGLIFEIEIDGYTAGSICGGGRYDNLIGIFAGKKIPAVGLAFGFDRTLEAMEALQLFPADLALSTTQVLVTIFSDELKEKSMQAGSRLRANNINTEIYLGEIKDKNPYEKQLKYADQKNIPYVLILGPEEAQNNIVTVKNMKTREQIQLTLDEIIENLQAN